MKDYKEKMAETRKELWEQYWIDQTATENDFLDKAREGHKKKQLTQLNKWRTSVIKIAMHTRNKI